MRTSLLPSILLAAAAAATAQGPGGPMPPTAVETTRPQVADLTETVSAVGTLRAAESIVVRPELAGRIERVHFEEGQRVDAGAPLFTLDASLVRAEVNEWEANVAQSRREAQRAAELVERKLAAQSDLDAKRAALAVDEARLSSAKARLAKTVIKAPFDGVAGLRMVSPGEYVEVGNELVTLTQLDPIKLDVRVPEMYVGRVQPGQAAQASVDAFPGRTFTGAVYAIDPQLDPNGRSLVLRASLANAEERLRPGQFARVTLALSTRADALTVPEQALWPMGGKQFVYVVKDGKAELAPVTIGLRRDGRVEILSGLTPDAEVITAGQMKIGPGTPVAPVAQAAVANGGDNAR
jgi:membrane fusion protein (multidrug efflux system)